MNYYVSIVGNEKNTADVKAPSDMCSIMKRRGYIAIPFVRPKHNGKLFAISAHIKNWFKVWKTVKKGDVLVYQYPLLLSHFCVRQIIKASEKKHIKVVLLIHDIDSLRGFNEQTNAWKEQMFFHVSYIICHNDKMKEWLINRGVKKDRLISLEIFDYLTKEHSYNDDSNKESVIIAGNLSKEKSSYIDSLLKSDRSYLVNLYGPNFKGNDAYRKYEYFGSFSPNELISHLKGGYGLVWDGNSVDECSGMTGRYLQFNNPHKASLYIVSGIPVIIWKKAALSEYIEKNNLGRTVDSLNEIEGIIHSTSQQEYEQISKNVKKESLKLRKGYYLNKALDLVEKKLKLCKR